MFLYRRCFLVETKLKKMRVKKGLSQSELAKLSNHSLPTIISLDQGKRDINESKIKTLVNISEALNCGITEILEDEELIKKIKL